jgi:poly-gamma-glutamate synthesis protein (capsule biosynthesis protein)
MMIRTAIISLLAAALCGCASFTGREKPDEMSILFCGDVMLDWGVREIAETEGYTYPLARVRDFLESFDYRVCNLECPIAPSGTPHPDKKYIFLAPPETVDILASGRFSGVSLANNHSTDFGVPALMSTMTALSAKRIQYTGAGNDADEARAPILLEKNGLRAAVLGITNTGHGDAYATRSSAGIAKASLDTVKRDIQNLRRFNDFVMISIHWGDEYADFPSDEQVDLARALIDGGADAVIGHHAHVYQGIEIYRGRPIVYSLGNFLFGSINEDIRDNIVVSFRFKKEGAASLEVFPLNGINDPERRFQPKKMTGAEAEKLLSHLKEISLPLGADFPRDAVISDSRMIYIFKKEGPAPEQKAR